MTRQGTIASLVAQSVRLRDDAGTERVETW
jgi:hypothetical protein